MRIASVVGVGLYCVGMSFQRIYKLIYMRTTVVGGWSWKSDLMGFGDDFIWGW